MFIIPAIDLRGGRCVRLFQGRLEQETVYGDDPVAMARRWQGLGAERLHVVDLDGAFEGRPVHLEVIRRIAAALSIPIQVGGGIRNLDTVAQLLDAGAARVILGTAAVENPDLVREACRRFPGRIMVGIDARDGQVAVRGWVEATGRRAAEVAREMADLGVEEIIVTDISRDGTLSGPNTALLQEVASASGLGVIASGGVASLEDILSLAALEDKGIRGVIVGKALYDGAVHLPAALIQVRARTSYRRVIPCLDLKGGRVVKGVRFQNLRDMGDPLLLAQRYEEEGADELAVLDIAASEEGRGTTVEVVERLAQRVQLPLMVGGGVSSAAIAESLLAAGARKVLVGSAAVSHPPLLEEVAKRFGRHRIVLSMDVLRSGNTPSGWELVVGGGKRPTGKDALEWARYGAEAGAGEILLNSIDADGTRDGYDNALNRAVAEAVGIPVIASGGAGSAAHMRDAFIEGKVDAVLAASIFHEGHCRIHEVKAFLRESGIRVREVTAGGSQRPEI